MDLRQIRYFTCLYKEQNVTRAARRLNIGQPAVSTQVRRLEDEFGVRLFERTSRGVMPTASGRTLHQLCRPLLRDLESIRQHMTSLAGKISGEILAGVIPSITHSVLAETLAELASRHPDVVVRLSEGYSGILLESVMAGSLDFAIVNNLGGTPGVVQQRLVVEPLVLVTSARPARVSIRQSRPRYWPRSTWCCRRGGTGSGCPSSVGWRCSASRIEPRLELDVLTPTLRLVEMSDWATIMPGSAVLHDVREGRLAAAFAGPQLGRKIMFAHRAQHPLSLASKLFIRILVTFARRRAQSCSTSRSRRGAIPSCCHRRTASTSSTAFARRCSATWQHCEGRARGRERMTEASTERRGFLTESEEIAQVRKAVQALCAGFPAEYWRELDRERAYPEAFVTALTDAGYLGALIPEAYDGSGLGLTAAAAILEEVHASGCNGAACHATDVHHGRHPASRQRRAEAALAAGDSPQRVQAAGLWRDRADERHRHPGLQDDGRPRWRPLLRQRAEGLDLARSIPISCSCSSARRRASRRGGAPTACRPSSST